MKLIYFKGDKVSLTGETITLYGGLFHKGIYLDGHKKGEEVVIANNYIINYKEV